MTPNPNAPSQKLAAVVTAFRALVATIQGTSDPAEKLNRVVNSMGDMATVFEQITATAVANEQQQEMVTQHVNQQIGNNNQVQQQLNQKTVINNQFNSGNQQTNKQLHDLRQALQTAQAQASPAGLNHKTSNRKPLCESKIAANLKMLGSKKEGFKNWNEKLINATTQVFGHEWRSFVAHLNELSLIHI